MNTKIKVLFFMAIMFLINISFVMAQNRHALVIGNNKYTNIERLNNPVKDATDIAAKLRTLGYQVELQTDIGKVAMDRAIHNYMQRLALNKDNEGFFWFAGHGVQIDGENYLLPIDVDSTDDISVKHTSYSVKLLTDSFDSRARNKVNIVVLDACRNNPFRNMSGGNRSLSRGLSVIQESDLPPDLLIIYSTAAGDVAADNAAGKQNSPFAEAFINNMDRSEDITIVVRGISRETLRLTNNRQEPFTGGRIRSLDYYSLNPRSQSTTAQTSPAPVQPSPPAVPAQPAPSQPAPAPAAAQPPQRPPAPSVNVQKYALVIGNGNYSGISSLMNPVNDANDIAATLQGMGFTVDKVLNGNLEQMESAVFRLKNRLSASKNSYGFFFYAGHGVQSSGENYLIPVTANNISRENHLRQRAVSVQKILDEFNEAGNTLNVMVLDACRDNPFAWARSGSRGLAAIDKSPDL